MGTFSVLTLTHNRDDHLHNMLRALAAQDQRPAEVVVVYMNQAEHRTSNFGLDIVEVDVRSPKTAIPLAQARNQAAEMASGDDLLFVDVDCIVDQRFCTLMLEDIRRHEALVMGDPRYLSSTADVTGDLLAQSRPKPSRESLQIGRQSSYDMFWSLCFGLSAEDFRKVGGFNSAYTGYGAEDTDFARRCAQAGLPFYLSEARAFHQHHTSYSPSLNHFEDIVANAEIYKQIWGDWPMSGWLTSFDRMGLIRWSATATDIEVIRAPSQAEIESALAVDDLI